MIIHYYTWNITYLSMCGNLIAVLLLLGQTSLLLYGLINTSLKLV